jgi:hypothetical protein
MSSLCEAHMFFRRNASSVCSAATISAKMAEMIWFRSLAAHFRQLITSRILKTCDHELDAKRLLDLSVIYGNANWEFNYS